MNINKKYAIRKLAVGIASVSIGMFISNTPEVAQTLGSVGGGGGVIQAFDNGTEITSNETTKQWKPEGSIVATGEDGVPWELYENGYLLFKPVPGKNTLSNEDVSWKHSIYGEKIKAIGFTDKVYLPEDSSGLFSNKPGSYTLAEFLDTSKIDTSKVKNMSNLFFLSKIKEINLDTWDTSNVTNMSLMFDSSEAEKLNISNLNTKNVRSMNGMFSNLSTSGFKDLDLSKWDTSNVTDISRMFTLNYSTEKINVSNWDTSKITKMEDAFSGTHNLKEIKGIENWNTSNVKTIHNMFAYSENLKSLNLSKWNTSNVEDMSELFLGAEGLAYLNIENWDTGKVESFDNIFSNTALTHLKIGNKFAKTKLTDNPFKSLDDFFPSYDSNEIRQHNYKWTKLDKTTPFYTVEEWNKVFRENPDKLAGMWVREKYFREDVKKIVNEEDKELKEEELVNYTEPNYSNPDGITTDKTPIYKVKRITTTYKGDESLDKGQKVVEKDGKTNGNKVVRVGTKATVEVEKLPSPVRYEKDNTREKGQENITVKGKDGSKTTTTTYTVNPENGEVVPNVGKPVVVEPTETVVKVAAKDKVSIEKLPSPVRYEKDNSREKGQENITVKGKDGSKTTTTTYTVNPKTGEVVPNVGKPVVVEPTETIVKVAAKDKVVVEKLPSPVRYEKDTTREKGQENITIKGKDGSKTTTTTYTVNDKTGEVVENVGKPVVVEPTETVVKVAAKDKVEVVNKKDGETVKVITSYEVNPKTGELKEVKKEELLSKKGIPEVSEESKDFKDGVNPTESIVREDLPELKVALIKDGDGNVLEVIKEDEEPKDIQGYKNTDKTEVDKDGYKVYIYEKLKENKQESPVDKKEETDKPKTEEKVISKDKEVDKDNNKEAISKKEELPKTSSSMLSTVGLLSVFGLRKNRKKNK